MRNRPAGLRPAAGAARDVPSGSPAPARGAAKQALRASADAERLDRWEAPARVVAGHYNLFGVVLTGGVRHHVARLESGVTLYPLPSRASAETGYTLIAVGVQDACLEPGAPASIGESQEDRWLATLISALCGPAPAWPEVTAVPGASIVVPAGKRVYAGADIVWLRLEEGDARTGIGALALARGDIVPVGGGLAIDARSDARFAAVSAAELIDAARANGLELAYRIVLAALAERVAQSVAHDVDRLGGRRTANQRGMLSAMRHLSGLAAATGAPRQRSAGASPRINALTVLLDALRIAVPQDAFSRVAPDVALADLARAAGIDLRRVALRGDWWLRDNGPLLAQRRAGGGLVVLLPRFALLTGRFVYRQVDPESGIETTIDGAAAADLASDAVMPYRRLPVSMTGPRDLWRFVLRGSSRDLGTVVAMGLFSGLLAAAIPVAVGLLFSDVIARGELGQLPALVLGLALAAFGMLSFDVARAVAVVRIEGRMGSILQPAIMRHLMALPVAALRGEDKGDLTVRVLGVQRIMKLISGTTIESILAGIFSLTSLAVIVYYSPLLALLALAVVAFAGVVSLVLGRLQLGHERVAARVRGREDGLLVQGTQAIGKIRTTQSESRFFALWSELFGRHKMALFRAQRIANMRDVFLGAYPQLATMALFFVATALVLPGAGDRPATLSLGDFLAIYTAFGQLLAAGIGLATGLAAALEAVPQYERLRSIIQTAPESAGEKADPGPLDGPIEISHVSFRYSAEMPDVLDDVSLRIEPGSFTAIVGPSGSGKSTLARLLLGLETAQGGDILYQGQSLSTLDPGAVRRRIGVVLQSGRLFSGSLFDNITAGLPFTLDDAWAAARLAGLADDIESMPMGMHTLVVEGISGLSGGQTQRILLARALIGKPNVLLLDEATSALDNTTQAVVSASLEQLRATRIVIAHRLSTIRHADQIHVVERGRIVESGNFESLIARQGVFAALARRQL